MDNEGSDDDKSCISSGISLESYEFVIDSPVSLKSYDSIADSPVHVSRDSVLNSPEVAQSLGDITGSPVHGSRDRVQTSPEVKAVAQSSGNDTGEKEGEAEDDVHDIIEGCPILKLLLIPSLQETAPEGGAVVQGTTAAIVDLERNSPGACEQLVIKLLKRLAITDDPSVEKLRDLAREELTRNTSALASAMLSRLQREGMPEFVYKSKGRNNE